MFIESCTYCRKRFEPKKDERICPQCTEASPTLPLDEWDEMTSDERKAARAKGIVPLGDGQRNGAFGERYNDS